MSLITKRKCSVEDFPKRTSTYKLLVNEQIDWIVAEIYKKIPKVVSLNEVQKDIEVSLFPYKIRASSYVDNGVIIYEWDLI